MREDWIEVKLGDVCEKAHKVKKTEMPQHESFMYLDIGGIDNLTNRITDHKVYTWDNAPSRAQQIVKNGDVLFSTVRTYLKKIAPVKNPEYENQICSSGFAVIRGVKSAFNSTYAFFISIYEGFLQPLNEMQTGTSYPAVRDKDVFNQPIPLPPLPEQRAIVAKIEQLFSDLDNGIANLTCAKEKLIIYRQALLKKAFEGELTRVWRSQQTDLPTADELLKQIKEERTRHYEQQLKEWQQAVKEWEKNGKQGTKPGQPRKLSPVTKINPDELSVLPILPSHWGYARLSDISEIGSGMSVSKNRKLEDPIEFPYLRVANVQRGFLDLDVMKTMAVEKSSISGFLLKKWDVLFNEGGDRDKLGRGWIWESKVTPCITQNHVFRASLHNSGEYPAKLISYWGNTFGRDYFERTGKQTTNLASINKGVLSMFPVPVLSTKEQHQIVQEIESRLSVCDKLAESIDTSLQQAEALRQSILKRAFEGNLLTATELTACRKEPDWEPAENLIDNC